MAIESVAEVVGVEWAEVAPKSSQATRPSWGLVKAGMCPQPFTINDPRSWTLSAIRIAQTHKTPTAPKLFLALLRSGVR